MILENNWKIFHELQNRIIGKILSIVASSLALDGYIDELVTVLVPQESLEMCRQHF